MGLLDEAIREHMELKRLRGADPGEVARQERDALGPVVREHDAEEEGTFENLHEAHDGDVETSAGHPRPARGPDFANVGQETAELDMRTVLEGELEDGVEEAPSIPGETPGQERLWFDRQQHQQQQAPRDFDFDP
jgi:hypothetical protein